MKRCIIIFIFLVFALSSVFAQHSVKLSPFTQKLIYDYHKEGTKVLQKSRDLINGKSYVLSQNNNRIYAGALIKVSDNSIEQTLSDLGVLIGTKAGNIWSVKIPVETLESISMLSAISYIQVDEPCTKNLDSLRHFTKVNEVHNGLNLPKGFTGKDVIIGIVDNGFDYTNPVFLDPAGTSNRIKRIWEQGGYGSKPVGFSYGREIKENQLSLYQTDSEEDSHGTHVSGIAGGSGLASGGQFTGVAPSADYVLGSFSNNSTGNAFSTGQSTILDGINYIFQYAASVNKPAVVNLSLGIHIGPHDGTSLFDQACDALAGKGKIIVGAAGNEGNSKVHISHQFSQIDSILMTFPQSFLSGGVDIWGEQGKDFCFRLYYYDYDSGMLADSSDLFCTQDNLPYVETYDTIAASNRIRVYYATSHSEFNNKPRASIGFSFSQFIVGIKVFGTDGKIDMWNITDMPFESAGLQGAKEGDYIKCVGEIGGTGIRIISVGSYTTRNSYTNIDGNLINIGGENQNISSFSSRGPTADGRVKPEITAPGSSIISSVNSFDTFMQPMEADWESVTHEFTYNNKNWHYAAFDGTSMATPATVGVIALMLEANPTLTPEIVKEALKQSAIKDNFTGNIGSNGDNTWGRGKLNAYDAVKYVIEHTPVNEDFIIEKPNLLFPNPSDGRFSIINNDFSNENLRIELYDVYGSLLKSISANVEANDLLIKVDAGELASGYYFVKITNNVKNKFFRVIIYK